MTTVKSNAAKTKGQTFGWAFADGRKAFQAARKHGIKRPSKKQAKSK